MRRLPIYFVLDVSESMIGEPLRKMEEGIGKIVASLRQDPHSLETVYISLIVFAGQAKALTPLIDLVSFYPPKMPIGGGTSLGKALDVLMSEIDTKVKKTSFEERGDWQPVVFLITDGRPTDNPNAAVAKWKRDYASKASLVSITLGNHADMHILKQLSDEVLALENSSGDDFNKFIEWVSASVRAQSQKIEIEGQSKGVSLTKLDNSGLTVVDDPSSFLVADPEHVVLTGRCSKKAQPYLLKYSKIQTPGMEQFIKTERFALEGAFVLDESYFEWSNTEGEQENVNTSVLEGTPPCPCCGNPSAFAICHCNKLLCLDASGLVTCPWCESKLQFNMQSGGGDFNVGRGQG